MKTSVLFLIFACALIPMSAHSEPLSLDQVMTLAKEKNPDILAARQSWKVTRTQTSAAKAWPDPTFTYIDEQFPDGTDGMANDKIKHYRVEQMVPFPGKISGDARMKFHEALVAETKYQSKVIEILGDVRIRYYQLYLTDEKIALASQSAQALKSVLQTSQSRLASGQSSTSDVFMAQMELRKMENMLFEEQQARTLAQIELNTLLNQPTDTVLGRAQLPEAIDIPVSLAELQTLALNNSPEYIATAHETNHAKAMMRRNRLEFAPDFGLMYERETSPGNTVGRQLGLGVTFPLWLQRPWANYKGAQEHLVETEAMAKGMQNMVMKMVHMEQTETITHLTLLRNYERDILPIAQSNLKIARDQYASGRGEFLRILEAFRAWTEANNEYQEQVYHYGEHWSLLERWVGIDLSKAKETLNEMKTHPGENHHAH